MDFFAKRLLDWYKTEKRDLPWRQTTEPYKVWLSEVILQQTRVIQGLPYYERFVETFPTITHLAIAEQDQVFKLWQGLGYYSRATNLHQTAQKIVSEFDGDFPSSYKELLTLKGIGDYTASAVASICYSEPCAVVDGNVFRVLARVFNEELPIDSLAGKKRFKDLATQLLDKNKPGLYNQALMDFGALQCKPQNPDCLACIFSDKCEAYRLKKTDKLPVKKGKIKIKNRYFNYLVFIDNQNFTSIKKRISKDIWQGLYEFPLIETDFALSEEVLLSELKKMDISFEEVYLPNEKAILHKLSHQHIHTKFWIVKVNKVTENEVAIKNIANYPMSVLTAKFIDEFWNLKK